MSTKKSFEKKWTKEEFIQITNLCDNSRIKVWWFFLWHKHVTLLNVVNVLFVNALDKLIIISRLDKEFFDEHIQGSTSLKGDIVNFRIALLAEKALVDKN